MQPNACNVHVSLHASAQHTLLQTAWWAWPGTQLQLPATIAGCVTCQLQLGYTCSWDQASPALLYSTCMQFLSSFCSNPTPAVLFTC